MCEGIDAQCLEFEEYGAHCATPHHSEIQLRIMPSPATFWQNNSPSWNCTHAHTQNSIHTKYAWLCVFLFVLIWYGISFTKHSVTVQRIVSVGNGSLKDP